MTQNKLISEHMFNIKIGSIIAAAKTYEKMAPDFQFKSIITFSRGGLVPTAYVANALGIPSKNVHIVSDDLECGLTTEELRQLTRQKTTIVIDDILDTCATMKQFFKDLGMSLKDSTCKFIFVAMKSCTLAESANTRSFRREVVDRVIGLDHSLLVRQDEWAVFPWEDESHV